jgi:hypothetical protein
MKREKITLVHGEGFEGWLLQQAIEPLGATFGHLFDLYNPVVRRGHDAHGKVGRVLDFWYETDIHGDFSYGVTIEWAVGFEGHSPSLDMIRVAVNDLVRQLLVDSPTRHAVDMFNLGSRRAQDKLLGVSDFMGATDLLKYLEVESKWDLAIHGREAIMTNKITRLGYLYTMRYEHQVLSGDRANGTGKFRKGA